MLDRLLVEWVREAGWEPCEPALGDVLRLGVGSGTVLGPMFEILVAPAADGDATPCYARAPGLRVSYRVSGDAPLDTADRAKMLSLLDQIVERLRARAVAAPGDLEMPVAPDALGTGDVLETGGGRNVEHLLRIDFHCNQACPFCFVRLGGRRLDPADLPRILPPGVTGRLGDSVVLTGGEPTLHPELLAIIAGLRQLGVGTISMQTNAVRFADLTFCRAVVDAGVRQFMVSFHGHRPETYDRLTGSQGQYPRAIAGIRNLCALGADLTINVALTRQNVPVLDAHMRLIAELIKPGPMRGMVFFTLLNEYGHLKAPDLAVDLTTAGAALDRAIPLCHSLELAVEPFFGDCSPPLCCLTDPTPVVPASPETSADVFYAAAGGSDVPINHRVKAASCRGCRFDPFCRGVPSAHARLFGLDALRPVSDSSGRDQ